MKIIAAIMILMFFGFSSYAEKPQSVDVQFLDQFSEHHKDAIEMAKMAENKAENKELRKIAKKIVKEQSQEVERMKFWRQQFYSEVPKTQNVGQKMDMTKLEKSSGHEFDMAFSEMMVQHHQKALDMIQKMSSEIKNGKIKQYALQSSKKQKLEKEKLEQISEMR